MKKSIVPKESAYVRNFTNLFLLEHSSEVPELWLRSEEEYRLYTELKRRINDMTINDEETDLSFSFSDSMIALENEMIHVYKNKKIRAEYAIQDFSRSPNAVFRRIHKAIIEQVE